MKWHAFIQLHFYYGFLSRMKSGPHFMLNCQHIIYFNYLNPTRTAFVTCMTECEFNKCYRQSLTVKQFYLKFKRALYIRSILMSATWSCCFSLDSKCGQVNVTIQVTYSVVPAVSVPRGANKIIILTITMPKWCQ